MGLLDKIKAQKNEVKYSIIDKKIMIGGKSGCGKSSLLHEMSNIIAEETGNNEAVLVLPLENRYSPYVGFRKYVTPELDFYNTDPKLKNKLIFQEPTHYKNFLHVVTGIQELVAEKLKDPTFPVQVVAFDTFVTLVDYAKEHLKYVKYQQTKVVVTDNSYGNYGLIYKDALELIKSNVLKPLEMVNYNIYITFHMKEKSFKDKVTEEEYVAYAPEIPSSIFDNVVKIFDYSIIFEDDSYVQNGTLQHGSNRTLRWRNGNNYTGCKATATLDKIPAVQDIKGLSDNKIARLVIDTIINSIAKEGYTADKIKAEIKETQEKLEKSNAELVSNLNEIEKEGEAVKLELEKRKKITDGIDIILKMVNADSRVGLENFLKGSTDGKSISEWVEIATPEVINKVVSTLNGATSGLGLEPLPTL
jgi:energy-coupling factor transporter ATP-binding protein EcfA2